MLLSGTSGRLPPPVDLLANSSSLHESVVAATNTSALMRELLKQFRQQLQQRNGGGVNAGGGEDAVTYNAMASLSAALCVCLGVLSMMLNLFVIIALLRNRRRVLKNVFYVIVLNCAVLDLLRGFCLIVATGLYLYIMRTGYNFVLLNMTRYARWLLRQCNLMTMLNLLVFTSNEFVVIRFPLHYRRYCRRRVVLCVLLVCWIISLMFGVLLTFAGYRDDGGEGSEGMIILFVLCYVCLVVVGVCYGSILRTIRAFHSAEARGSLASVQSPPAGAKAVPGGASTTGNHRILAATTIFRRHHSRWEQKRGASTGACPHSSAATTAAKSSTANHECNGDRANCRRCNSARRWRSHLMSRHKYLLVIGSVLLVDVLFLCPYSGIQILSLLHLGQFVRFSMLTRSLRWLLHIMIGIHSVCQPLCYFRMTEFRRLACCGGRRSRRSHHPWNKSKSFSQHKSFANTRYDGDTVVVGGAGTLESGESSPQVRNAQQPLIEHARMVVAPITNVRFRTYGKHIVQVTTQKRAPLLWQTRAESADGGARGARRPTSSLSVGDLSPAVAVAAAAPKPSPLAATDNERGPQTLRKISECPT